MENHRQMVSIKSVIGKVIGTLKLNDVSSSITQMADWASDAVRLIGSKNSFVHIECELEVENYRACLPMGFMSLIAVRHNGVNMDATFKDFRHFSQSLKTPKVDESKFNAGNLILQNPGQPNVHQVNFIPPFQIGDVITISVTQDSCGDATINSFTHVVAGGETLQDIIMAFVNQINGIPGLPYTANQDSSFFQIIAVNNLVNLQVVVYTDSATGAVTTQLISRRILPTQGIAGDCDTNCDVTVKQGSEHLADRDAALLNDSFLSNSGYRGQGSPGASKYAMDNGYLHFNQLETGKVGISYQGIQLDDEGWPMIFEGHVLAVNQYLMWQYDIANARIGKVSQSYLQAVERRWYTLCAQARGDDELLDPAEMDYLANTWMQLIPLPNHNLF